MDDDLASYIQDNYGICSRGSDCYLGKSSVGYFNGCLKVGWRGKACPYWQPVSARTWDEFRAMLGTLTF